jgi:hypothetical protein
LEEEGDVDLITAGPDGRAVHFVAWGDGTKPSQGPDGLEVYAPAYVNLVELLPYVPAARYSITVQMRPKYPLTNEFIWGVYCKHSAFTTEKGPHHLFHALWLHGSDPKRLEVTLQQRLFCDLGPPAEKPFRDLVIGSQDWRFRQDVMDSAGTQNPWQTLHLQVDPSRVVATCAPSVGKVVSLGPLTTEYSESQLMGAFLSEADLKAIQPAQLQGSTLGLFVRTGVCTVRQFIVHVDKDN